MPNVDIDQSKSMLRSILSRFGVALQLTAHAQLLNEFDDIITAMTLESRCAKDDAKELWKGILNGGGKRHVTQWERKFGAEAPALAQEVMEEVRRVLQHTVDTHADMAKQIRRAKGCDDVALTLHTVQFQKDEREIAMKVQKAMTTWECDGDVLFYTSTGGPVEVEAWKRLVLAKGREAHQHLTIKPYPSQAELTDRLVMLYPFFEWR
jgi:hypothetical protein